MLKELRFAKNVREQVGKLNFPSGQALHFFPLKPALHVQRPVSLSQFKLAEPYLLHLQAERKENS